MKWRKFPVLSAPVTQARQGGGAAASHEASSTYTAGFRGLQPSVQSCASWGHREETWGGCVECDPYHGGPDTPSLPRPGSLTFGPRVREQE